MTRQRQTRLSGKARLRPNASLAKRLSVRNPGQKSPPPDPAAPLRACPRRGAEERPEIPAAGLWAPLLPLQNGQRVVRVLGSHAPLPDRPAQPLAWHAGPRAQNPISNSPMLSARSLCRRRRITSHPHAPFPQAIGTATDDPGFAFLCARNSVMAAPQAPGTSRSRISYCGSRAPRTPRASICGSSSRPRLRSARSSRPGGGASIPPTPSPENQRSPCPISCSSGQTLCRWRRPIGNTPLPCLAFPTFVS